MVSWLNFFNDLIIIVLLLQSDLGLNMKIPARYPSKVWHDFRVYKKVWRKPLILCYFGHCKGWRKAEILDDMRMRFHYGDKNVNQDFQKCSHFLFFHGKPMLVKFCLDLKSSFLRFISHEPHFYS